jgi:hypothetical protein
MKAPSTTFLLIAPGRVGRADFAGDLRMARSAPCAPGTPVADAARAALALGGAPSRETWVLSSGVWAQEVRLSPAQVAGLSPEQLGRALCFEAEPFSGIAAGESAAGYRSTEGGVFLVAQMRRAELDAAARAIAAAGGRLAGVAHPGSVPEDEEALMEWWRGQPARMGSVPMIAPPAPGPSPHRFLAAGIALEAAALLLLFAGWGWHAAQRGQYERRQAEFAAVAGELDAVQRAAASLRGEIAAIEEKKVRRAGIHARRGSLLALLDALAASCPDDVVVRGLAMEGPSGIVVSGLSLDASAVEELSIVLTARLRGAGWTAQPRSKTARQALADGGPWEFSMLLVQEDSLPARPPHFSHRDTP